MKAGIVITDTGPILILTSYDSFTDQKVMDKFRTKGIDELIAHEVSMEKVKEKYGMHYQMLAGDLDERDDLRALSRLRWPSHLRQFLFRRPGSANPARAVIMPNGRKATIQFQAGLSRRGQLIAPGRLAACDHTPAAFRVSLTIVSASC